MRRKADRESLLLSAAHDDAGVHTFQIQKLSRRLRPKTFTPEEVERVKIAFEKLEIELLGYSTQQVMPPEDLDKVLPPMEIL